MTNSVKHKKIGKMTMEEFKKLQLETPKIIKDYLENYWKEGVPVDAVKFANKLEFNIYSIDMPGKIDGILLVDETGLLAKNKPVRRIAINSNLNREDARFVIMHEVSHYIVQKHLHPGKQIQIALREEFYDVNGNRIIGKRDPFENHIDYMASCLLMPEDDVKKDVEILKRGNQPQVIEFLSLKYKVSKEMAKRRIEEVFCEKR